MPSNRQMDGEPGQFKRSFLDKFKRLHNSGPTSTASDPPTDRSEGTSSPRPGTPASPSNNNPVQVRDDFNPPVESSDNTKKKDPKTSAVSKIIPSHIPFIHSKDSKDAKEAKHTTEAREAKEAKDPKSVKDAKDARAHKPNTAYEFESDTTDIAGLVQQGPVSSTDVSNPQVPTVASHPERDRSRQNWSAPESWVVKKQSTEEDTPNIPDSSASAKDNELSETDAEGKPFCLRIFRHDAGFTTISSGLKLTVSEVMKLLARKSFMQNMRESYEIVMWRQDRSRQLHHSERPIYIQKQLLEQAGYEESDRISDIGREDNSYICRFTFLQTRYGGFSSRGPEPNFTNQDFTNISLGGRSLITIPIALFTHSNEIVTLDLSYNPTVKVPKDFIQRCRYLRELKFIGNEATSLPSSFAYAENLTYLDVSNNHLHELDHIRLHRLQKLSSFKMANNNLDRLPDYLTELSSLNSINISSNNFSDLPIAIRGLKELDISFNNIAELPGIGNMTRLKRLWITNNRLEGTIADDIKTLTELKEIDARFNDIKNIDVLTELPNLKELQVGHNAISQFVGSFRCLRKFAINHCPLTVFDIDKPMPSLTVLNIASGKLVSINDDIFVNLPNLTRLDLNNNRFVNLSRQVGTLRKLEWLSMVENRLSEVPPTIGCLTELRYLNLRECNLVNLPPEIWYCRKLEMLNVSSNVLESFPLIAGLPPSMPDSAVSPDLGQTPNAEEDGGLEDFESRQSSNVSKADSSGTSLDERVASATAIDGRVPSASSYITANTDRQTPAVPKDSTFLQILSQTFALSLHNLSLADNKTGDHIFQPLSLLRELRVLNLSYNDIHDVPNGLLKRWRSISELYLSGNELSALPADDFEENSPLRVLHLNSNNFQVLPSELSKLNRLTVLDVGNNGLKYNVSNWRYDWNWNWNTNLKYLNFSGNKRFEVKPPNMANASSTETVEHCDLTNFSSLHNLRVLGLMDVTITAPAFPDENKDRLIRTYATVSAPPSDPVSYGMADTLGRCSHLSMIDMMISRFRGQKMETLVGMFDGTAFPNRGSNIAAHLSQNFKHVFMQELKRLRDTEDPTDALRRTFLALNKDIGTLAYKSIHDKDAMKIYSSQANSPAIDRDDNHTGATACVLFIQGLDLYAANVGDVQALIVQANGQRKILEKHDPANPFERARIRRAGGYVSRVGKMNNEIPFSRAFGYFPLMPAIIAAPTINKIVLTDEDELVIMASSELWKYISPDVVSDIVRSRKYEPLPASEKLRDVAIAHGATNKLMVVIAGVRDLRHRQRLDSRGGDMSWGSLSTTGFSFPTVKQSRHKGESPTDSRLARLERVIAPTGEVAIIFTDIKDSSKLWEKAFGAMQSAIQIHNELFRRQLVFMGGYEAKTEGDAFMITFATPTAALLWCFACQGLLLKEEWPAEILNSESGREEYDEHGHLIFRGLRVRMGIHWGTPVCERDPVTSRMDYFGPMVNRASRVSGLARGGEIYVSSDYMSELRRILLADASFERRNSTTSEESTINELATSRSNGSASAIRRELGLLSLQGWGIKDRGEHQLKGLESPEFVYMVYPQSLNGRAAWSEKQDELQMQQEKEEAQVAVATTLKHQSVLVDSDELCHIWKISTRLEQICSAMESSKSLALSDAEMIDLTRSIVFKQDNEKLLAIFEHMVTRIEGSINTLALRNMIYPFSRQLQEKPGAVSMSHIWQELRAQYHEVLSMRQLAGQFLVSHNDDDNDTKHDGHDREPEHDSS